MGWKKLKRIFWHPTISVGIRDPTICVGIRDPTISVGTVPLPLRNKVPQKTIPKKSKVGQMSCRSAKQMKKIYKVQIKTTIHRKKLIIIHNKKYTIAINYKS